MTHLLLNQDEISRLQAGFRKVDYHKYGKIAKKHIPDAFRIAGDPFYQNDDIMGFIDNLHAMECVMIGLRDFMKIAQIMKTYRYESSGGASHDDAMSVATSRCATIDKTNSLVEELHRELHEYNMEGGQGVAT